ncbi:MAG: metal-dependent hydrolase [Terracidiphilus sp.]|jgi:inner membrane protein
MEPVTHFLTGACIGRAGLNRKTRYATLAAVLAAEAADIDVLWGLAGPVEELKHHRGITHTLIAVPVVAAAAVGLVWVFDRCWEARRNRALVQSTKAPPVHWGWLYLTALISALSHLLLDWTNNYGLRPFFPFNPRWYAGSLVFIYEPVMWALLLAALIVPWLLGLVSGEIGAKKKQFRGRGWAIFALAGIVLLWGWRWAEQGRARTMAENMQIADAPVKRMALEPYPVNPFRWHAILETAEYYQTAEINTYTGEIVSDRRRNVLYKPTVTAAVEAAKRTSMGQVYLDWGTWAVVRDVGPEPIPGLAPPQVTPNQNWTTVEFEDLRWKYSFIGASGTPTRSPLAGWVYIVDGRDDAGEVMNGRVQR